MHATAQFRSSSISIGSHGRPSHGGGVIQPLEAGARALGNYFQRVKRTIGKPEVFRTRSCSYSVAVYFFPRIASRERVYIFVGRIGGDIDSGRCAWSSDGTRILH